MPTATKRCSVCKVEKPSSDYSPSELGRNGPNCSRCRACCKLRAREWYERPGNAERAKAKARKRYKPHGRRARAYYLRQRYGLTLEAFDMLLIEQSGRCAICCAAFIETPHVDHCHETGRVRGLLCGPCNRAIGLLKDAPTLVRAALAYLEGGDANAAHRV